jgi:hypothetical protein
MLRPEPLPPVAVEGDEHAGPAVALDHARGDDPDHPGVPPLAGENERGRLGGLGARGLGREQDPLLGPATLAVEEVELSGHLARPPLVPAEQELERAVGAAEPARGVEPRREAEADGAGVEARGVEARDGHERAQAGLRSAGQGAQAFAHEAAVLAAQGHEVGHGGQGDEVEILLLDARGILPGGGRERLRELERHAGGAEVCERIVAHRRVDDRAVGQALGRAMVIDDHEVEPEGARRVDLGGRGDPAVDGDQEVGAGPGELLDRGHREPVAAVEAAREVPGRVPPSRRRAFTRIAVELTPSTS